ISIATRKTPSASDRSPHTLRSAAGLPPPCASAPPSDPSSSILLGRAIPARRATLSYRRSDYAAKDVSERPLTADLLYVPIVISMDPPDCQWAQGICIRLAAHADPTVRGNAILGFGHLARTCRKLDESV